jgi:hypothetical protein
MSDVESLAITATEVLKRTKEWCEKIDALPPEEKALVLLKIIHDWSGMYVSPSPASGVESNRDE